MFCNHQVIFFSFYLMVVEHETLSYKAQLLLIPQFRVILLCLFSYTLSTLVILQNHNSLNSFMAIYINKYNLYNIGTNTKE